MGILAEPLAMLRALPLPRGFRACELGDQYVTCVSPHELAADYYKRELGCGEYVSVDANGRGTVTADLNRPLSSDLGRFDLVTDFGTGEHVFNQHQVWRTLHYLCSLGGYIAFDRPTAGYPGHGFYLVDECLVRDVAGANEYEVIALERGTTKRGELIRGVFRRTCKAKFIPPYQGRYAKSRRDLTEGDRT